MREEASATATATPTSAAADEPNWFARWEEELPSPEELMPLSQTLITPDLALAFDIPTATHHHLNHQHRRGDGGNHHYGANSNTLPPSPSPFGGHHLPPPSAHHQSEFDSADLGSSGGGGGGSANNGGGGAGADEPARTLKRPRLVWTPQLHKRFVDAVAHLGIKNAVPKTIMQLMSVDGLTRENVASHLQKYRLYLKRMQGLNSSAGAGAPPGPLSAADAATDQLFANGPIPPHFLTRTAGAGSAPAAHEFVPFVPMAALQHHQQQMAAAAAAAAAQQFYHQRQMGSFGTANGNGGGGFDHGFLARTAPAPAGLHRMGPGGLHSAMMQPIPPAPSAASYVDDLEERSRGESRKVLTLFPTGDD